MKTIKRFTYALAIMVMASGLTGCLDENNSARSKNLKQQAAISEKSATAIPVPQVNNFLAREAVAKQVKRLDERGKLFYIYMLGDNGQQIGYYVSNTRPVSTCSLLTPPQEIHSNTYGTAVVTAPGIGGVYTPAPNCGSVFFFDANTDAYIETSGFKMFVSDQPLSIKSAPIEVINK